MNTVRNLKTLLLGETWLLPLGIATVIAAALLVRHIAPGAWQHAGGFVLLAGVLVVLLASVGRGAQRK
jgi:hypothetical protein